MRRPLIVKKIEETDHMVAAPSAANSPRKELFKKDAPIDGGPWTIDVGGPR
jgi:hypothetical protein